MHHNAIYYPRSVTQRAHQFCVLVPQDFEGIMNPPENLAGVNTAALILWDVFEVRYAWGQGSIIIFMFPLGCSFFCALHGITSAARYATLKPHDCSYASSFYTFFGTGVHHMAAPPWPRYSTAAYFVTMAIGFSPWQGRLEVWCPRLGSRCSHAWLDH